MTMDVWNYVFFGGELPQSDIPEENLRSVCLSVCLSVRLSVCLSVSKRFSLPAAPESFVVSSPTGTQWTSESQEKTSFRTT